MAGLGNNVINLISLSVLKVVYEAGLPNQSNLAEHLIPEPENLNMLQLGETACSYPKAFS